ncbi:LIRP-like [Stegodyphus dumicola]|uniref:LIRP-like n=1 Tax=Stegodyphus dumicola TaxID=202533 RepID=UPI0015B0237C|nr:LIRP-like [Stegodyphus dumicola]
MTVAFFVPSATDGGTILETKVIMKRDSTVQVCGQDLANALSVVCGEGYNEERKRKRNFGTELAEIDSYPQWLAFALTSSGQREARQTNPEQIAFHNRRPRGIVDECCMRSCTIETLMSYCARLY